MYPGYPTCERLDQPGTFIPGTEQGTWDNNRCIIVRGVGWQKDTLLDPLICTGLFHSGEGRASYEQPWGPGC